MLREVERKRGEKEVEQESDNNRHRQLIPPIHISRMPYSNTSSPTGLYVSSYPKWTRPTVIELVNRVKEGGLVPGTYINFNIYGRITQFTVRGVVKPVDYHIGHRCAARDKRGDGDASRHVDVLEV